MRYYIGRLQTALPNILSAARLLSAPVFVFCVYRDLFEAATILFSAAALTDFFDGYLARKWNAVSGFGKIIDPAADKVLMIASYYVLAMMNLMPTPVAVIVILRDILISGMTVYCKIKNISLQINPLFSSKVNTALQLFYVFAILISRCFWTEMPSAALGTCAFVVCVSTVFSAFEYAKKYFWIKNAICHF